MASISLTDPVAATTVTAGLHAGNNAALRTAINGGLDNTNVAGGAAIDQTKIAFTAWTVYSPTWAATGVAPVLNNGTLTGKYAQVGKTVVGRLLLTAGAATTFGTGTWTFTLPATAAAAEAISIGTIGTALAVDTGVNAYTAETVFQSTTTVAVYSNAQPSVVFSSAVPFAWGNTDTLAIRFMYEAA